MSEIRATTISDAAGTGPITLTGQSAAKAWVNFNGLGTIAIRESFNGSSLSDIGTGDYRLNFSSSMNTATYSFSIGSSAAVNNDGFNRSSVGSNTASQGTVKHYESSGTATDTDLLTLNIFGDLA